MMIEYIWPLVATIVAILPIVTIKQYLITNEYLYIVLTMLLYSVLMISYVNILKTSEVSKIYPILQILQIIIVIIYGIVLLDETLYTEKIIGIGCGFISIYLLSGNN
jgi:multidrug transporter EmrE-like cation transporter